MAMALRSRGTGGEILAEASGVRTHSIGLVMANINRVLILEAVGRNQEISYILSYIMARGKTRQRRIRLKYEAIGIVTSLSGIVGHAIGPFRYRQ